MRDGTPGDVRALVRLHANCSSTSIHDRFHAPMAVLGARLAGQLLSPAGGFSLVVERSGELVGVVSVTPLGVAAAPTDLRVAPTDLPACPVAAEAGLLVVDSWHRQGIGTRLLLGAVRKADRLGFGALQLTCRPGNTAVLPLVTHAGLRARVSMRDGLSTIRIALTTPDRGAAGSGRRSQRADGSDG